MKTINGNLLRDMIISGANNVSRHMTEINDLNVFPVPDGDTGTNMSMTLRAAVPALEAMRDESIAAVSAAAAAAQLRGARGNSGVITSLLFRGFAKELEGESEADGQTLARAFDAGVKAAYKAVMKPTEGTILTVSRVAAEEALRHAAATNDPELVLLHMLSAARDTLDKTPDLLPVLKQAGVVDSGGKGYVRLLEGMVSALSDGVIIATDQPVKEEAKPVTVLGEKVNFASLNPDDFKFAYCTEFFINRTQGKQLRDASALRLYLDKMGDSLVFVDDGDLIKVHVHSNAPGRVLQEALKYGYLSGVKIENMVEQYADFERASASEARSIAPPEKPLGVVAVAPGKGFSVLFAELLADRIVEGGQTMNPAVEDLMEAIDQTPAEVVFVLPNNKNIILSAEMAAKVSEKKVVVLPTATLPEGVAALMNYDKDRAESENLEAMTTAFKAVKSGSVTYAVRDSVVSGKKVRQGDMMGLFGSKLVALEKQPEKALVKLVGDMAEEGADFVTVYYGSDVSSSTAEKLEAQLKKKFDGKCELLFVNGGQPVYHYLVSVE